MSKYDLTGMKFNKLYVIDKSNQKNKKRSIIWNCGCECGNKTIATTYQLRSGEKKSCGCLINKNLFKRKHGKIKHRLYNILKGMKDRCYSKDNRSYKNYGSRGIRICDEWLDKETGFIDFYNWAMDNGYSDELSIDRIDVNGNYEPSNCRWATNEEQQNNTRINNIIEINGVKKSVSQWSRFSGVSRQTIRRRLDKGISGEELLKTIEKRVAEKQSGVERVKWDKHKARWKVDFKVNGKVKHIGYFKELEDAIKAKDEYMTLNKL